MNVVLPAPFEPSRPVMPGADLGVEPRERDRGAVALHHTTGEDHGRRFGLRGRHPRADGDTSASGHASRPRARRRARPSSTAGRSGTNPRLAAIRSPLTVRDPGRMASNGKDGAMNREQPIPGPGSERQDRPPSRGTADGPRDPDARGRTLGGAAVRLGRSGHMGAGASGRRVRLRAALPRRPSWRGGDHRLLRGARRRERRSAARAPLRPRRARSGARRAGRSGHGRRGYDSPLDLVQPELQRELLPRRSARGGASRSRRRTRPSRLSTPTTSPTSRSPR